MPRKLNFGIAEEIRHKHFKVGFTQKDLAFEYGVSQATISQVLLRKFYAEPTKPPYTKEEQLERKRRGNRVRDWGLTDEQIEHVTNGKCEACGGKSSSRWGTGLHVDHDHNTGRMRGFLCNRCNSALGFLDDDIVKVEALLKYMKRHHGKLKA